ncbi:putative alpha/beta hydrolase-3, glycosyltransferase, GlcNAc, nucleotide-diphospho-sugar transferase [Plasmopara halstedii]
MKAGYLPYGRVSSRGALHRSTGLNLRVVIIMAIPFFCLVVVLYEFLYLQEYAVGGAKEDRDLHIRTVNNAAAALPESTNPPSIINGRHTIILVANYRDSTRCSETLRSIFDNAKAPDNLKLSIYDQIYPSKNESQCVEAFCKLVGEDYCRRSQIVSSQIDASYAKGPTAARYETEKEISDEDFCMAIDSHLVFVPDWDENIMAQWDSIKNPNAIISVYPKAIEHLKNRDVDNQVQLMCQSRIESNDRDAMVQYAAPVWIDKKKTPKPRLMSQLAGGFNFGGCKQTKEVRNDPYTPYLFHGEEYSRAARLWTAGYDFYVPSDDIAYHWYETRNVVWESDWNKRYIKQQASRRRIRYILGLPVTKEDFDRTDLKNFSLGTKRTFQQWKNFSGIDPLAKFISSNISQFDNCRELELQHVTFALALLVYARNTGRNLSQLRLLLQQTEPHLSWPEYLKATLRYFTVGQLIAGSEYLLCLVKPRLAARIGRLLVCIPHDCRVNCRFGPHKRNMLDFYGVQTAKANPVLVFVHGGAWSFGHKWQYALVGEYLATQGVLVAVIDYRTFPNGSIVDMIEDVENAIFWVAEYCRSLGGDSTRLFLMGHSSGGHVGALALVNSAVRLTTNDSMPSNEREIAKCVRGFIGLSTPYDISDHYVFESKRIMGPFNGVHEISSMKPAMLGMNNFEKFSPTALVEKSRSMGTSLPPFHILHGEDDTVVPTSSSKKFVHILKQKGQEATYYEVSDCTHEDMVFAVMGDNVDCRMNVIDLLRRIVLKSIEGAVQPTKAVDLTPLSKL